jgi:hypothetical protein
MSTKSLRSFDLDAFQGYAAREARRLELEREARTLAKENELFRDDLEAALDAAGKTSLTRGPHEAGFEESRAAIAWKTEFIRVAGADAASELAAAAPSKRKLVIRKAGA